MTFDCTSIGFYAFDCLGRPVTGFPPAATPISSTSSIVTTRPDGARPALHKKGATGGFFVTDAQLDRVLDTKILHVGGVGLVDRMDKGRTAEVMAEAKRRGCTTNLDVRQHPRGHGADRAALASYRLFHAL